MKISKFIGEVSLTFNEDTPVEKVKTFVFDHWEAEEFISFIKRAMYWELSLESFLEKLAREYPYVRVKN